MNLLNAIGYGILHILWQTGIVYVIFVLTCKILAPSHRKVYGFALLSQLTIFLLFIFNIVYFARKDISVSYSYDSPLSLEKLLPCLSGLYFVFLAYSIAATGKQINKSKNIRYNTEYTNYQIVKFIQKKIIELDINRKIQIVFADFNNSPFIKGFLKPAIYLPVSITTYLNPQQVEAILLHELIHIKRYDYFINLIQIIIEKTLYFNPLVKSIGNIARYEREVICDEEVSKSYERITYSEALFSIAKYNNLSAASVYAAGNSKTELLDRIRQLHGLQATKTNLNHKALLATIALSCFALVPIENTKLLPKPERALAKTTPSITNKTLENINNQSLIKQKTTSYTTSTPPIKDEIKEPHTLKKKKAATDTRIAEKAETRKNIGKAPEIEEKIPQIYTITAKNNSPELQKAFHNLNRLLQEEQLQFRTHNISNIETPDGSLFNAENHFQTENYTITVLENDFETKIIVEKTGHAAHAKIIN